MCCAVLLCWVSPNLYYYIIHGSFEKNKRHLTVLYTHKVVYRTVAFHYKQKCTLFSRAPQCIFPTLFLLLLLPAWFRLM